MGLRAISEEERDEFMAKVNQSHSLIKEFNHLDNKKLSELDKINRRRQIEIELNSINDWLDKTK